ncbi:hypothetical protein RI367_007993 [Sorochytrium milnesiophthora]
MAFRTASPAYLALNDVHVCRDGEELPPATLSAESTSTADASNNGNSSNSSSSSNAPAEHRRAHTRTTRDIVFPSQQCVLPQIAIDIGGSLAKVAYFEPSPALDGGGRLTFRKFETARMAECAAFVAALLRSQEAATAAAAAAVTLEGEREGEEETPARGSPLSLLRESISNHTAQRVVIATGGGAHKYHDLLTRTLGVRIEREDEMECLVRGLTFLVAEIPDEVFSYSASALHNNPAAGEGAAPPAVNPHMRFKEAPADPYPYLLVNIGSGVSMIKVTGEDKYERISGTSLGGGTFWGLLSMMARPDNSGGGSFDEMLEACRDGDNAAVDMLVGDIYGADYSKVGLKSSTIASSFGKAFRMTGEERGRLRASDIGASLLYMLSNNIGQIAYLNAQAHGLQRIYFGGYFIRGHPITMNTLSYAINYWSRGTAEALFLRHEGYLGAIGAFLKYDNAPAQLPARSRRYSVSEHFVQWDVQAGGDTAANESSSS